jgi:hypothetical protein
MNDRQQHAMTMLDHALAAAAKGFRVFPVRQNGKVPLVEDWPNRATTDPDVIRKWWTDALGEPANHNVGIAVGNGTGVLDFDIKGAKRGMASFQEMRLKGLPESLTVTTPSGGFHVYLKTKVPFPNKVEKLAEGVDTRGDGGYVLAPGSTLIVNGEEVPYRTVTDRPIAEAPNWLVEDIKRANKPKPSENKPQDPRLTDYATKLAIRYLVHEAPEAIEGSGGDETTVSVARRLHDFGVPEPEALDLLLEHWNETKASPPWNADDLQLKVRNGYKYAKGQFGGHSAAHEFEPLDLPLTADHLAHDIDPDDPFPAFTPIAPINPDQIKQRQFIFEGLFAKGMVQMLGASSGVGKTQLTVQLMLSAALGRSFSGLKTTTRMPRTIAYWNNEDDMDEINRRILATSIHFGIEQERLHGRVHLASGVGRKLIVAKKDKSGIVRPTPDADKLIHMLRDMNADMLILDPLVEFHACDENSNVEMAAVVGVLRKIANEADVALFLLHHDRKPDGASSQGFAGSQHAMRGASAIQGVTRAILTLYGMSEKDAANFGVTEDQRHLYVRLDVAKNNLGLAGGAPVWFKRVGVPLRDRVGPEGAGDVVGVLEPIEMEKIQKAEKAIGYEAALLGALATVEGAGLLWTPWRSVEPSLLANSGRTERSWRRWLVEVARGERDLDHVELRGLDESQADKQRIYVRKKGLEFLD